MVLEGAEQSYSCIKDSENAGVAIIYQELGLVRTMNVCENIFLGNEIKKYGVINWDAQFAKCRELLKRVGLNEDPTTEVGVLGTGKQQLIEIAKALSKNVKVLILDEPTSSLTEADTENLLNLLKELRSNGITCIFISHKLNEVMVISDTITVLRDGKTITTKPAEEMSEGVIISYMVGRELTERFPRETHTPGEVVLETKNWTVANPEMPHKNLLDNINFKARKGEILGIAGLMGAGRTEFSMSLFGALKNKSSGEIIFEGKPIRKIDSPKKALDLGIAYLSEDRKRFGLVLTSDVRTNMTMASLDKLSVAGVIDKHKENKVVRETIGKLKVKTPTMLQIAQNLSGGNQQKVVFAKALLTKPKVLFLDEPTRGIDVGSKYEIYQLMNRLVDEGICIIMISSELPEILGMSDRIYVMHEGKLQAEFDCLTEEVTQEKILYYAAGGEQNG